MSNDTDFTHFGQHVVCLLDVLGQKNKLEKWAVLPDDGQTTPKLLEDIRQTVGVVMGLKNIFIQLFNQLSLSGIADQVANWPIQTQQLYQRIKECDVGVERFSDTFVFSSLVPNSQKDNSVIPLYRILSTCCVAMITTLLAGTPVRGAVTIGTGAVLEDNSFYGPALKNSLPTMRREASTNGI